MNKPDINELQSNSDKPVFALMHGSWHGAWCWGDLRDELESLGFESVAVEFPNDVPGATFDDYRDEARYQIERVAEGRDIIAVAHSRAANVAPRLAGSLALKHIVYLCGSFEDATLQPLISNSFSTSTVPEKYSKELRSLIKPDEWGMSEFDEDEAIRYFFHDCAPDIQWFAPLQLRRQYKSFNEPQLESWPDTPQTYIMATQDRVISPVWSAYIVEHFLKIPLIKIDSGHSPFYSQPQKLAALLINISERDILVPQPRTADSAIGNQALQFAAQ